jgi:CubicO group peptidase (beta-lactamase class C family)
LNAVHRLKRCREAIQPVRRQAPREGLDSGYGVGFQLTRRGTLVALGHGGSTAGFRASALVDRASKTGVIVLRNADTGTGRLNPTTLALAALEKVAARR